MRRTPNFNLNIVEPQDFMNPLTQDVPNYETIDTAMFQNKKNSIKLVSATKSLQNFAITSESSDFTIFFFVAPADYNKGDTFTLNAEPVKAVAPNGDPLPDKAFKGNAKVLCIKNETGIMVNTNTADAQSIDLSGYMKIKDYVGEDASGTVAKASKANLATNAEQLDGQLPSAYSKTVDFNNFKGEIKGMQVVSVLPGSPTPGVLYLIKE